MLLVIKSAPDTQEADRGISLAADLGADLVLIQNAVYLARSIRAKGFRGKMHVLDEDLRMRGLGPDADIGTARRINYDTLVDLITQAEPVHGAF